MTCSDVILMCLELLWAFLNPCATVCVWQELSLLRHAIIVLNVMFFEYCSEGGQHVVKIVCCTCYSVSESFLWQGLWPATPVEPTLTTNLMEFALALVMECQVSIFDLAVKALEFTANPLIKVCLYLY